MTTTCIPFCSANWNACGPWFCPWGPCASAGNAKRAAIAKASAALMNKSPPEFLNYPPPSLRGRGEAQAERRGTSPSGAARHLPRKDGGGLRHQNGHQLLLSSSAGLAALS